jgi:hypothetical protein
MSANTKRLIYETHDGLDLRRAVYVDGELDSSDWFAYLLSTEKNIDRLTFTAVDYEFSREEIAAMIPFLQRFADGGTFKEAATAESDE